MVNNSAISESWKLPLTSPKENPVMGMHLSKQEMGVKYMSDNPSKLPCVMSVAKLKRALRVSRVNRYN